MRPGKRFGLSGVQKSELWSRWKAGQSLHEIGCAFDKSHSCDSPLREIARRLDRAASTLSREISRHGGRPAYSDPAFGAGAERITLPSAPSPPN
jgi:Helix-turn-helix domain